MNSTDVSATDGKQPEGAVQPADTISDTTSAIEWEKEQTKHVAVPTPDSVSHSSSNGTQRSGQQAFWHRAYAIFTWTPPRCRWDPKQPPVFSMWLNVLFGFAGAFTVANLYYSHPILNILAEDFGVEYVKVSEIPTLAQAGYAVGLLLLCPLGDLLRRRPFVLYLVFLTATLT